MITEIALSTAATGVIAGISYAVVKTCAADNPQPAPTRKTPKGIWVRRFMWTIRYALLATAAVTLIPLGLFMGIVSLSDIKRSCGVRLAK